MTNRYVPGVLVVAALVVAAAVVVVFVGGAAPETASNSSDRSVCIDGAGGYSISSEDVRVVRNVIEDRLADQSLEVFKGCPPSAESLGEGYPTLGLNAPHLGPQDSPSPHRLFTYLLSADVYGRTFGNDPYTITPAEFACEGDVCWPVTTALYVPSTASRETLREGLLRGVGLRPGPPNPEPVLDWGACARGTPPHPDYSCDQFEEWLRDQAK